MESQLESLEANDSSGWSGLWESTRAFFLGRGLTILLAITGAIIAWLVMRSLWWFYSTKVASKQTRRQSTMYRLLSYSYYIITGLIVIIVVLFTLWIREDLLLLCLLYTSDAADE